MIDDESGPSLPWRADGLDGFSTSHGHTFDGGTFTGGGPHSPQTLAVRLLSGVYGRPATVEVDLCDDGGGRSVTLDPQTARNAASALMAAADKADAEMAHWRGVVEKMRADLATASYRDALGRSGAEETT